MRVGDDMFWVNPEWPRFRTNGRQNIVKKMKNFRSFFRHFGAVPGSRDWYVRTWETSKLPRIFYLATFH